MEPAASPDWNDIRYFLAVARTGSLSAAAKALQVRHTTVGRRLDALERALGGSLTLRLASGVELTPLGKTLLPHAEALDRGMQALQAATTATRRSVRLALPSGFSRFFAEAIADFHQAHPSVSLELMASSKAADLVRGEADIALRMMPVTDGGLVARKLGIVGWSLYASPSYLARHTAPEDPRQLGGHELIGFHSRLSQTIGARWIETHGAGASIAMRCGEMTEMLAAVRSGAGLGVLPCIIAEGETDVRRLSASVLGTSTMSIVFRREIGGQAEARAVIRFAASIFRRHRAILSGDIEDLPQG